MTTKSNRSSLSRRAARVVSSLKAMLFKRLFRSSIYESVRPMASGRMGWLETLRSLIGKGAEEVRRSGALKVSAKERAKRSAAREFRRRFVMAEQLELRALMAADLSLDSGLNSHPVAAEVGSMVAGQDSTSQSELRDVYFTLPTSGVSSSAGANLAAGVAQATARLSAFAQGGDYASTMQEVFGRTGISNEALSRAVAGLQAQWASGDLGVRVEVLSGSAMNGGLGAFAADYQGSPAIFVNSDWLASNPGSDAIAKVLIEEFGHSLDRRINAGVDSPGDEGELFSDRLLGTRVSIAELSRVFWRG